LNDSLSSGTFPDKLKLATVVPVHKAGSETDINNYRPISVLPLLSKIFERCFCNRLVQFLNSQGVISANQFGFQKSKNTTDAILNFIEGVYDDLNCRKHVLGVSIDLRKAFDTVCHDILLRKLEKYGVRGLPLVWLRSYLRDRYQSVRIGAATSGSRLITCGVPQGSILGPVLFLVYINDLPNISNSADFTLFADDTTLSCSDSDYSQLMRNTNFNIDEVFRWI